jgi:hypothetical protein
LGTRCGRDLRASRSGGQLQLLVNNVLGRHRQIDHQLCGAPPCQRNRLQRWDTADEQGSHRLNRLPTASVLVMKVQRGSHVYRVRAASLTTGGCRWSVSILEGLAGIEPPWDRVSTQPAVPAGGVRKLFVATHEGGVNQTIQHAAPEPGSCARSAHPQLCAPVRGGVTLMPTRKRPVRGARRSRKAVRNAHSAPVHRWTLARGRAPEGNPS